MTTSEIKKKVRDAVQSALVEVFEGNADSAMTYVEGIKLEDALTTLLAPMLDDAPTSVADPVLEVIDKVQGIIDDPTCGIDESLQEIARYIGACHLRFRTRPEVPA